MKKVLFLITVIICSSQIIKAQDKIYRNNGKVVEAKVLEVGASEVKYKEFNNPDGPIYVLETDRIKKIVYENGKVETFSDNYKDPERYAGQKSKALKINFLSPLYGYFEASYEKSTSLGKGYEFSLGIIGAGKSGIIDYNYYGTGNQVTEVKKGQFGFFATAGYKFGKLPDFLIFGKSRASHLMQGTYIKPLIYLGHYKENILVQKGSTDPFVVGKQNVTFGALQIELGRQWVFGDKITLDIYEGLGYAIDNKKDNYQPYNYTSNTSYLQETTAFNYGNVRLGKSPALSFTFGVKIGMLLK
ncbi:hypothetical protein [Ferruginibacter sp.]|nr:hypothetical protein [Ferruginibacter sp.]